MKILVIRFKEIGDAILSSVICNSLKKTFPNSQIDYVVYEHIVPLFEKHEYIDNVIAITEKEQKNIFLYLKKVWKITRTKYDIIIDIMSTPKSEIFILFGLNAKYRIGRFKKYRGYTYTHKIKEPQEYKDKVDKFLRMLNPLEVEYNVIYDENYSIFVTNNEKNLMRQKMKSAGVDFNRPVFVCAINSRVQRKVYPIQDMLIVVKTIQQKYNGQIIFFYSKSEKDFAINAHKILNNDKNIFTNIETKDIRDLAALISNCNMFFGNEGGPRHLAQAVGVPSFSVFCKHSIKKEWLSNANQYHKGIGPYDIIQNLDNFSDLEAYKLITPQMIIDGICEIYEKI